MDNFNFIKVKIEGFYIIESKVFRDGRGYFMEDYNKEAFGVAGLNMTMLRNLDLCKCLDYNICPKEV